jgi:hypothetical protein
MRSLLILLFGLISSFSCYNNDKATSYVIKFKKCENIIIPAEVILSKVKVAAVNDLRVVSGEGCLAKLLPENDFKLTSAMVFYYKEVMVGDPYVEIVMDSSKITTQRAISSGDTLIVN